MKHQLLEPGLHAWPRQQNCGTLVHLWDGGAGDGGALHVDNVFTYMHISRNIAAAMTLANHSIKETQLASLDVCSGLFPMLGARALFDPDTEVLHYQRAKYERVLHCTHARRLMWLCDWTVYRQ